MRWYNQIYKVFVAASLIGFLISHFIKDMGIALKEAEVMGLSLPGLALVKQLYLAVQAQGHGRLGTQSLTLALEKISGM